MFYTDIRGCYVSGGAIMDPTTRNTLIIIAVIMVPMFVYSMIKGAARKRAIRDEYKKYTGRVKGKILDKRTDRTTTGYGEEERVEFTTYVSYEFEANGQMYRGYSEGSGALWKGKSQYIRFDPDHPENNCTEYYYNNVMSGNGLTYFFMFVLIGGAVAFAVCRAKGII